MPLIVEDGTQVENANSYVTLAEANAFYEMHLYASVWAAADDTQKSSALVMATRSIDAGVEFKGSQITVEQTLEWPRYGVTLPYDASTSNETVIISGEENVRYAGPLEIPANVIPKQLKNAVCEFARFLLAGDRDSDADSPEVKREKVDVIETENFKGTRPDIIPESALRLMRVLVVSEPSGGRSSAQSVAMQRR